MSNAVAGSTFAPRELWTSRMTFLCATLGSAIGLGNLWRFPFMAGENGGGAFVLVYIFFAFVICAPLIMAELAMGRHGGQNPVHTMAALCAGERASHGWIAIGWISILNPLLALCFYSVVAGWSLEYLFQALRGTFTGITGAAAAQQFDDLLASPGRLFFWYTLYIVANVWVIGRGIRGGIEKATTFMLPSLFVMLVVLVIYGHINGDAARAWRFLFAPDFSKLTGKSILGALGQALFSVSVGTGALLTYGAHVRRGEPLAGSGWTIAIANLVSAVLAGLAIFPIVFAAGLDPASGPGLMFVSLPVALGGMPASQLFSVMFFLLVFFAAFTSSIAMFEPFVEWLVEHKGMRRVPVAVATGTGVWGVGTLAVLSFNVLEDFRPLSFLPLLADFNIFRILDFVVSNIFLPLNAFLIALFAGWVCSHAMLRAEIGITGDNAWRLWNFGVRYAAPVALGSVLVFSLLG